MDRRWWGTAMVVLVLLVALVVPNLAGRRVDGAAIRVPIPGPPVVGQCLLADGSGQQSALNYAQVVVAAVPVGSCADATFGEVVSVTADHHDFPSTVVNRMRRPEPLACQPIARRYVGWPTPQGSATDGSAGVDPSPGPTGDPGDALGPWWPVSTGFVGLLGPDISQYLSGQGWIACVVYPRAGEYAGTVRGGRAGPAAAAFGSCQDGAESAVQRRVSCRGPHDTEIFAIASTVDADSDVLTATCRELVMTATAMADPTAGGELAVDVMIRGSFGDSARPIDPGAGSPVFADPVAAERGQVACVVSVAGDRKLVGSLSGLGDGPLPWA
jgi:hypothetical protein